MSDWREQLAEADRAILDGLDEEEARAFFYYLFTAPRKGGGRRRLRTNRVIGLYDPFADRRQHRFGAMLQSAAYVGCTHRCSVCYARSYIRGFNSPSAKKNFRLRFVRCLKDMRDCGVPATHLSMANSTDPLQAGLEREHRHTLYALETLRDFPVRFSSIGLLTRAPNVLLEEDGRYLDALIALRGDVQVSIAFFRDEVPRLLEPGAPPPSLRRDAVEKLIRAGVRVALRLDPLYPRGVAGITEYQSLEDDIEPLVEWAAAVGVSYVITSPLKLVYRRNVVEGFNETLINAFPIERGGYLRMLEKLQGQLLDELRAVGKARGIRVVHCFHDILARNPAGT